VEAVHDTFNAITVDGECSTNDSVFALASGASGVRIDEESIPLLTRGLQHVCRVLATNIVRDGEGATKLVTVTVTGAASDEEARRTARAIGNSLLVKTAIHGGDPNWGRLLAVAGRSDVAIDPARVVVKIGPAVLYADGRPHNEREQEAAHHLEGQEVSVSVDLGTGGTAAATMWTCDLTADYVRINADYRT
jgi:glutamate N-acetyltransferase/amino-acid N-acetyltransferase